MEMGGGKRICKFYPLPSENAFWWDMGHMSRCGVDTEAAGDRLRSLLLERVRVGSMS